ncbi:MAG: hypothetical protein KME20_17530 [Kaiparowitsia implicata GSE-PSE-MK54-09C]|nr:hypothetical protein [Kaiparowitsia implicata GSE-PSE-MK54-09C]
MTDTKTHAIRLAGWHGFSPVQPLSAGLEPALFHGLARSLEFQPLRYRGTSDWVSG